MSSAALQPRMLDSPLPGTSKGAQSSTSYTSYPSGRPFINSDFQRSLDKPVHAYPESNGKAIISALKNLQEKLRQLELDRLKAEQNIKQLAKESSDYRQQLDDQRESKDNHVDDVSRKNRDLTRQLLAAQSRCSLLEKHLEYMKKTAWNAESERNSVLQRQVTLESDKALEKINLREKLDKLEQEYMKLTTIQVVSENKIRDIEQKLREEEGQRKRIEEKATQLQSSMETNRILFKSLTSLTKDGKGTKPTSDPEKRASSLSHRGHTQPHYRLSLGDVPFVAGTSTAPSHSVGANVQHVLHLMKQHNKVLCNDRVVSDQPIDGKQYGVRWKNDPDSKVYQDLSEILLTLEDEFGQMSFDHQELLKQIHKAHSDRLKMDLEFELATLVRRMETKADQITKVRKHQARLVKLLRESRPKREPLAQDSKSPHRRQDKPAAKIRQGRGSPGEKSKKNLQLLRDMQTIQSSLQREDVHWS
ncbi:PREDICTED: centrosomal protein of 57 kDa [Nanorana parkeri]|uniref:centrosomal protein of 57 kDa n=1 Tax=Nanorana parkeri TaxID=125878 RepID=UPI0008546E15|nr:PREDICTED: centrosomal protein of 57 kDa [Nanorana parkeri]